MMRKAEETEEMVVVLVVLVRHRTLKVPEPKQIS
jgi:hypothetical protein